MSDYDINYDDERFTQVESDKTAALSDLEQTYAGMINDSDNYYQAQIDASKEWAEKQSSLQQEQTDFAIEKIEQEKEQAKKDYTKEQSGAFVDWQKQSNQYGVNAEQMAASGMTGTGYSESSKVSMYNTYQNRVATARESYTLAVQNYNNSITEARLQNNSVLAEIAYEALQQQLELSLQGFQYKNQLILEKATRKAEIENEYYSRYQDVLQQINAENALAEEIRQYNESLALEKEQLAEEQRQFDEQMAFEREQYEYEKEQASASKSSSSSGGSAKNATVSKSADSGTDDAAAAAAATAQSIINLGYGPISSAKLDTLVLNGYVEEYEDNGVTKYRNSETKKKANTKTAADVLGLVKRSL